MPLKGVGDDGVEGRHVEAGEGVEDHPRDDPLPGRGEKQQDGPHYPERGPEDDDLLPPDPVGEHPPGELEEDLGRALDRREEPDDGNGGVHDFQEVQGPPELPELVEDLIQAAGERDHGDVPDPEDLLHDLEHVAASGCESALRLKHSI